MAKMILDVETCGDVNNGECYVYDLGLSIVDNDFNVIEQRNWVINDVYYGMADMMKSAYYANKLPQYDVEIATGIRETIDFIDAYAEVKRLCREHAIKQVYAFNSRFDRDALNHTIRTLSNGFVRFFMPYGTDWRCIQGASVSTFMNSRNYFKFCVDNGFVSPCGNVRTNAEAAFAYLTNDPAFKEAHTGLADVLIETEILKRCMKQHKKMNTKPSRFHWRAVQPKFKIYVS